MRVPLRLSGGSVYSVTLNPRLTGASIFGWVYVICESGGGTVEIADGATDQPSLAERTFTAKAVFGSALRADASRGITLAITAGTSGLQGELHIAVIPPNPSADSLVALVPTST